MNKLLFPYQNKFISLKIGQVLIWGKIEYQITELEPPYITLKWDTGASEYYLPFIWFKTCEILTFELVYNQMTFCFDNRVDLIEHLKKCNVYMPFKTDQFFESNGTKYLITTKKLPLIGGNNG